MDLQQVLSSLEKADAAGDTQAAQALADLARSLMGGQQPVAPITKPAGFSLKNVGIAASQGALGSAEALTNVAGAGNAASQYLSGASKSLGEQYTPERQAEMQRQQERMKKAEQSGSTWEEIKAGVQNIAEAPIESVAQGLGSFVPYLPAMFAGPVAAALGLSSRAVAAANVAAKAYAPVVGTAQGAGAVKGAIYDAVYKAEIADKVPEAEARQKAEAAQDYAGKNLDQIALGGVAGLVAARGGVEKFLTKEGREKAGEKLLPRVGRAMAEESVTEGAQGGQERLASNLALQRTGRDVPTFQGVAGQAAQEGIIGGLTAGPVSAIGGRGPVEKPKPEVTPPEQPAYKPVPSLTGTDAAILLEEQAKGTAGTDLLAGAREREPSLYQPTPTISGGDMASMLQGAPTAGADLVSASRERQAEQDRIQQEQKAQAEQQQVSAQERSRQMPGMVGTDTTGTQLIQLQREKQKLEEAAADKAKEIEYRKILATTYSADPLQNFRQQQAAIERLDYTTPEVKAQEPAMTEQLLALQREDEKTEQEPRSQTFGIAPPTEVAPVTEPVVTETKAPEAVPPVVDEEIAPFIEEGPMPKSIDQIETEKRADEQVEPIQKYIAEITKKPMNLWNVLRGRLSASDVSDISPDFKYMALRQPAKKGGGTDLSELVQSGQLDEFLPPAMRMSMQDPNEMVDETDAVEYIKEKLRGTGEDYYTYDTQVALKEAFGSIEEAEDAVREFIRIEDANELLAEAATEQRAIDKEAEVITPEGEDRTAQESVQKGLTAPTPESLKAADERAKAEEKRIADEKKAADDKAKADAEVGEFTLTGSERDADVAAAAGQTGLFEAKPPPELDTSDLKEVKGRHPQIQAAAKLLQDGKMTREQFEKYVDYYKPIQEVEVEKLLPPTSEQKMNETVNADKRDKINVPVEDGTKVGLRMDLPARERGGSVVSIHEGKSGKLTVGKLIGFRSTGWLKDVTFEVRSQEKGLAVAAGAGKAPQQTVEGTWFNLSPEEAYARVKELMKDPAWSQIGFDPSRHGYFYDRKTRQPVTSATEMYQVGQFLLAKNVKYAPKEQFFYSLEPTSPYSDLAKRNPSFKRKVDKLNRDLDSGKIELGEFANQVKWAADEADRAREATEPKPRERGADYIRQRLLEAKRRGDLSEEAVDFAEWFIQRNPQLLDDLGISIRKGSEEGVSGQYVAFSRIMRLIKESSNESTIVHEILHHMERMMPLDVQRAIRSAWSDAMVKAAAKATDKKTSEFFGKLLVGHGAFQSGKSPISLKEAVQMIKDGEVDYENYQYVNPSEFWAVNGTRIVGGRFIAVQGGTLQKLKNWLRELGQKIKSLFGLPSDAPIIKVIDSLSKADGKFVSTDMLMDVDEYLSITGKAKEKAQELLQKRQPAAAEKTTGGEAAMETLRRMGRDVEKPSDSYVQKTKQAWNNAVDNPQTTAQAVKDTLVRWSDQVQTWAFSSDAALNNNIRRAVMDSAKTDPEKTAFLINTSLSQTVHPDALASLFITEGNIRYNNDLQKWEAVKDKDNLVSLVKGLEDIAKKYGLTQEQAQLIGHTAFEAKRLKSLVAFNQSVEQEVKDMRSEAAQLRKEGKSKAADSLYEKATKRNKETKFIHMTDEQIADGNALFKNIPELDNLVKTWNGIRTNATKVLVDTGLWSEADADFLMSNADYVPFFREDQLENGKGPKEFIRGLQVQAQEKKLKGSNKPVNDIFDNMVRWTQYSINRGVRNRSAVALAEGAAEMGMARKVPVRAGNENVVRVWKNGEEVLYSMADPMFIPAFTGLESIALPSWKILSKFSNILRQSVVMYPLFSISQVPQDAFAAMFTSGLKPQYALRIPVLAVKEFVKTLAGKSKTHEELKMFGVTGVRDFTADMARVDAEVLAGLKAEPGILNAIKGKLHHIAMASDNAVRQATYEAAMAQGMSKSEALEKSFEIWNVRRKGSSQTLAIAGQVIPFFNAYLAAQNVAFNVITGRGTSPTKRADAYKTLAATTASVMTLSLLYSMMNGDDEDYEDKPAAQRDRLLMIPGTGGMSIPLRKDLYTMPKIITEHTYLLMTDKGYEDGRKFRDSIKAALASALFSPTAVPQAIKPLVEVGINYDFFTGRPIIGQFQKKLEVERQFNDTTAELAKVLGNTGLVSPLSAEHLIRGMFGSVGGLVLYATNPILHSDPNVERPTLSAREMLATLPGTSGFISREDQTGLKNDFYVLRDEVAKVASTIADLKARSPEKIEEYLSSEDVIAKYGMSKAVNKMVEQLGKIRKQITQITNVPSDVMTGEEKQAQIKELKAIEKDMLKSINVKELRAAANL